MWLNNNRAERVLIVWIDQEYSMDMNQHNGNFYLNKVKRS